MNCVRNIAKDIYFVGVDEHRLNLFENIHPIPRGVSYNSYILLDEKTVLFDTVDWAGCREFLENVKYALGGRPLDYLIINHMEPDHAASIEEIVLRYPEVTIISNKKAFSMMSQFGFNIKCAKIEVKEGDTTCFGKHTVTYVFSPMVHWPEAMVTFDVTTGTLFSADAFGSFGALNGAVFNDEVDFDRDWIDDARRYYTNIVGKFGPQVQALLKKAGKLDINMICPLHGPIWRNDLGYFIEKYDKWSRYEPEMNGVLIVYASMYGSTEQAAVGLASQLYRKGFREVRVCDVSTTHISELIALTFKYSHIVFASATYNMNIYPLMHAFLQDMKDLHVQKRTCAIMENGTWACKAGSLIAHFLDGMNEMTILNQGVTINSSVNKKNHEEIAELAQAIIDSMVQN